MFNSEWISCDDVSCRSCNSKNLKYTIWDSSDGAYTDYKYKCQDCNYDFWIEGSDY